MASGFTARVYDRSGAAVLTPADVTLTPARWSAAAVGGPDAAEVDATGSVHGLLDLAKWLGYRIEIASEGVAVWWGHIDAVRVTAGGVERETALEGVANRVKVLYAASEPGGKLAAAETAWIEDAESIAAYGKRELVDSASGALTEAQATARRNRLLAVRRLPQKRLRLVEGDKVGGKLVCRGDWQRLDDVYFRQLAGLEEHNPSGGEAIPLGLGFTSAYMAFGGRDNAKRIHSIYGRFANWNYAGLRIRVSGTSNNNGLRTVASADKKAFLDYTSSSIAFEESDDIRDSSGGLMEFAVGDVIWISGAALSGNNGAKLVKSPGAYAIEISPGWSGGSIGNEEDGDPIRILRGNSIEIEEATPNERPDGVVTETVAAFGQRIYQQFAITTPDGWTLNAVEVKVRRVGNPTDAVRLSLHLDSGTGTPGTLLEQVALDAAGAPETMEWVSFALSNTTQLAYAALYGLVIDRTGAMDSDNFYEVEIDPDGEYPRGWMLLHDGTEWQQAAGDLIFRCLGATDTARQIQDVVTGGGVELSTVMLEAESGLYALQHRAEEESAAMVLDGLLAQGTAAGGRLLATVLRQRMVRVYAQPPATQRLLVWREGELAAATGEAVLAGWLPVAEWVHLDDVLLTGGWAGLSPLFVERATYQMGQGWNLQTETQQGLAEMLGIQQG